MFNIEVSIKDEQTRYSRLVQFTTEAGINRIQNLLYEMGWTMESNIPVLEVQPALDTRFEEATRNGNGETG